MKKCPFCAEDIQDAAKVCKHCGRDIVAGASQVQLVATKKKTSLVTWFFTALFGLAFVGWCAQLMMPRKVPVASLRDVTNESTSRPPRPASEPPPTGGKWTASQSTSEMDDSKGVSLHLDADNEIQGWIAKNRPTLIVRCRENRTQVYVITGMASSIETSDDLEAHTVRVRIDDRAAERQRWTDSTDDKALFAPSPLQLARDLTKAKTLRLEFTPFQASPATVIFDVTGLDHHIGKVAAACKWKP